ncbi:eppin-like [Dromiciops gliroides]|uniref:eppin-like n=1 Tax=Dromiciops gliroides TaxID=33562 RepID=UPI001CC3FD47|nr:eppin-like [Dromiciops gliroides]
MALALSSMRFLNFFLFLMLITQGAFKRKKCPHIKLKCTFKERNYCTKDSHCEYNEKCCMLGCGKKCYNPSEALCKLPMEKGPCGMSLLHWWYNSTSQTCQQFTYGGCFGNNNNFQTQEICWGICKALSKSVGPSQP